MIIALDFDKTITADTLLWREFVRLATIGGGHECIVVTGRDKRHEVDFMDLPVVYAAGKLKREAAEKAGYEVDIWIDDEPGTIERCRKLEW